MFQVGDLARLNKFYILPEWAKRWFLSMRPSELDTFVASTPLVLSLIPFVFAPFPILASVALITTGADAVACLIGKKYGTHRLKKNSNKTIEGFIAGGITTLLIVFVVMNVYHFWMPISFIKILFVFINRLLYRACVR
jgi:dolichol kinase